MKVFVTGATGFVGIPVVKELIGGGHEVLGLARSEEGAKSLTALGAQVLRGSLEDVDGLQRGAAESDAVIHLAFNHDWSKLVENCKLDVRAIEAMGAALAGTDKLLIVTSGLAGIVSSGGSPTEIDDIAPNHPYPRASEQTALSLKNVRTVVVRLPQVHDTSRQGLVTYLVSIAREKGVSAYAGSGNNRWASAHISDVARLYRLALERNVAGARYHAVDEEGVLLRYIAETIGHRLKVPARALLDDSAIASHFGGFARLLTSDLTGSSELTQYHLGWSPRGPGLIADLEQLRR